MRASRVLRLVRPAHVLAVALAIVAPLTTRDACADEPATPGATTPVATTPVADERTELRHALAVDVAATGLLAGGLVVWTAARNPSTSASCTICDGPGAGDVNALDRSFRDTFRRRDGTPAETTSKILAYGGAPAVVGALLGVAAFADQRGDEVPLDLLLATEGALAGIAANEALGAMVLRERPTVHALAVEDRGAALGRSDALRAFPSGFTGSVMAVTGAAGTVASLRRYRLAPLVWLAGSALALATSYTRVAADRGYLTDELTGGAVGLLFGAGVPLLFHGRKGSRDHGVSLTSTPVAGGRVVNVGLVF